ncbi:MAG: hypothetical protein CMJ18_19150 [Phycisphaeraceae bacterium]|nr:hypothetical protein [Phycisphaeraceae bacterium]
MPYFSDLIEAARQLGNWADLRHEQGAPISSELQVLTRRMKALSAQYERLVPPADHGDREPNDLDSIRAARTDGPRRLFQQVDATRYPPRLAGAWLARAAGCTLGSPVEGWQIEQMEALAAYYGDDFPPTDYWIGPGRPAHHLRYGTSRVAEYTRGGITHVPVDDDLTYTLLGLIVLERYGPSFTTAQMAEAWLDLLPMACTAEHVTLEQLRAGLPWEQAGERNNPYVEWIGADIRSDPWGYAAPGWPEMAADLAWRDARLSHRRNGIYGAMFFSATIAAAFAVDDPLEACRIGLTEIPASCRLHDDLVWALDQSTRLDDFRHARRLVDERFDGMSSVHTNNNACLTVFGLALGGDDVTKVIGHTVAMGLDNDCTAATAGSIAGAVVGIDRVPEHWHRPFADKARTYISGHEWFGNSDILKRFEACARAVHAGT